MATRYSLRQFTSLYALRVNYGKEKQWFDRKLNPPSQRYIHEWRWHTTLGLTVAQNPNTFKKRFT